MLKGRAAVAALPADLRRAGPGGMASALRRARPPPHRRPDVVTGAGDGGSLEQTAADYGRAQPSAATRISFREVDLNLLEASDGKNGTPTYACT